MTPFQFPKVGRCFVARRVRTTAVWFVVVALSALSGLLQPVPAVAPVQAPQQTQTGTASHPTPSPTPTPVPTPPPPRATVGLATLTPMILAPQQPLQVNVTVTAGADGPVQDAVVKVRIDRDRIAKRSALQEWDSGKESLKTGEDLAQIKVDQRLVPGQSTTLTLNSGAVAPCPRSDDSGPRRVSFELRNADGNLVHEVRTFITCHNGTIKGRALNLSLLLPIGGLTPDIRTGTIDAKELQDATAPGGTLQQSLAVAVDNPAASVVIDPMVLGASLNDLIALNGAAAATDTPGGNSTAPLSEQPALKEWRQTLATLTSTREVFVDRYAVPEVAAPFFDPETSTVPDLSAQLRNILARTFLPNARTNLSAVAADSFTEVAVQSLRNHGTSVVVLPDAAQPLSSPEGATPSGRSRIPSVDTPDNAPNLRAGVLQGVLSDTTLSQSLATLGDRKTGQRLDAPQAGRVLQRLMADLALIQSERSSNPRNLTVFPGWNWDPDSAIATPVLKALVQAPWVQPQALSQTIATEPDGRTERQPMPSLPSGTPGSVGAVGVQDVATSLVGERVTYSALTEPQLMRAASNIRGVGALSSHWRDRPQDWQHAVMTLSEFSSGEATGVKVETGARVNLLSANVSLPVVVSNRFSSPAKVQVEVLPRSKRIVATQKATIVVPPKGQAMAQIPLRAIGNGDSDIEVQLLNSEGVTISTAPRIQVRVRTAWEGNATIGLGLVVAFLVLVGTIRSLRQRRHQRELDAQADAQADAVTKTPAPGDEETNP